MEWNYPGEMERVMEVRLGGGCFVLFCPVRDSMYLYDVEM
jgi:pantothenate synthetase